ncbi:MAG: hypothetical protein WCV92_00760 [Candidatus Buchananbacteria bacterium]
MNKNYRLIYFIIFAIPSFVGAQVKLDNPIGAGTNGTIDALVIRIIQYVLGVVGVAALIAFIYGGILWLTSLGDSNKVTKGKNVMIWAFMGLLIIFSSYAIVNLMINTFAAK